MNRDILDHFNVTTAGTTGVLQRDFITPFLFIILIDHLLKKAVEDADTEVVTCHPCQTRRQPTKGLKRCGFSVLIIQPYWNPSLSQTQLCRTVGTAENLDVIISVPNRVPD